MKQKHSVTAEKSTITFNSGDLAGLAGGSVTMELGETNLFVSVPAATRLRPDHGSISAGAWVLTSAAASSTSVGNRSTCATA